MTDTFDAAELPELPHDDRVVRALLGCLATGPQDLADAEWILVLADAEGLPIALDYIGLVFDYTTAPIATASEALTRAGYEHVQANVSKPWAAEWQIIRPENRVPA